MMVDPRTVELANGISVSAYDLDGVNAWLTKEEARGPGVALMLSGDLEPGKTGVSIVAHEPIGEAIAKNGGGLKLAAIMQMTPYYDMRHASYIARYLMSEVAKARGLSPVDDKAANAIDLNDVPAGDLDVVKSAAQGLVDSIDDVLQFEIINLSNK